MNLFDTARRPLANLRLSVTDRCNLRCTYCMPEEEYVWLPSHDVLSFEELSSLVDRFMALGVRRVRLTGGEPLVRRELHVLIRMLASKGLEDLALTTNGVLLADQVTELRDAGLQRVTVSLDTLRADRFVRLTKRDQLRAVLKGIEAARFPGPLKLDTVVLRGVNDDELLELAAFARDRDAELRFIEYMDVGGATKWSMRDVVPVSEIAERLGARETVGGRGSAPAERFKLGNGQIVGIIGSTTRPFCSTCDRARLTADGQLYTCLYATRGVDLKRLMRSGASGSEIEQVLRETWQRRADRGAEERLALRESRGPLLSATELKAQPHLEMHTRGG